MGELYIFYIENILLILVNINNIFVLIIYDYDDNNIIFI